MDKLKIVVTGAAGQLGSEFCKILKSGTCELGNLKPQLQNCEVIELSSGDLDITRLNDVLNLLEKIKPACVVNCAAFTNVDECETKVEHAFKVNAIGARNLAIACEKISAQLVHISTDYVFDGTASTPYIEQSAINPQSVYGKSKAMGEFYVQTLCRQWFIIRTSWLYGVVGKNFVKTIAVAAKKQGELKVVADQFGSPTNVCDLAFAACGLIGTNEFGIFHGSGAGHCSWFEFASEIVSCFKIEAKVKPCMSSEFVRPAKRPKFSIMENLMFKLTIGDVFRPWKAALFEFCAKINLNDLF